MRQQRLDALCLHRAEALPPRRGVALVRRVLRQRRAQHRELVLQLVQLLDRGRTRRVAHAKLARHAPQLVEPPLLVHRELRLVLVHELLQQGIRARERRALSRLDAREARTERVDPCLNFVVRKAA